MPPFGGCVERDARRNHGLCTRSGPATNSVGSRAVRAGSLIKVLLVSLVFAALATAVAIFVPWLPEQSSKEAERIDFVFWFVTAIWAETT